MKERDIERYLVKRVKELGGACNKVVWPGRKNAPDRVVMLPPLEVDTKNFKCRKHRTTWVEVKNPDTILTFPANTHERAQAREHERMRALGQRIAVVGTYEQVDEVLK